MCSARAACAMEVGGSTPSHRPPRTCRHGELKRVASRSPMSGMSRRSAVCGRPASDVIDHDRSCTTLRRGDPMRVLVAGDRGYIGAVLVPLVMAADHDVEGLDAGWYDGCDF